MLRPFDRIFRALSDPTRLRILHLLSKGELCVCDIMDVIGAPQPRISRHLAYLKRVGLVRDRKEGPWRHYSLADSRSPLQNRLLKCVSEGVDEMPLLERDARKLADSPKGRCR
jgi:ArsR family transcriptional regulator, arsenate/arsenite/antimonite-responsive transcriptional repressor